MGLLRQQVSDDRSINLVSSALVSSKVVDSYDMSWAERESRRRDKPLLEMLVELELVTPMQLKACLDSLGQSSR